MHIRSRSIFIYYLPIAIFTIILSLCYITVREVSADTDYACLPIPQEGGCLSGAILDMAKVSSLTIDDAGNSVTINATITTFYEMNSSTIYIMQITNANDGSSMYINWKPFAANENNLSTNFLDKVELESGEYFLKVMVWTEIDRRFYPLILKPEMGNSITISNL